MVDRTLNAFRGCIESLASESGEYYLRCARTGDRPVPTAETFFDDRETARAAAHLTERYRATLREYDPELSRHDIIVCQRSDGAGLDASHEADRARDAGQAPGLDAAGDADRSVTDRELALSGQSRIEYCHAIAGAVFETITASAHEGIRGTIVDTYLATAETTDPDALCLHLLRSTATELDARLDPEPLAALLRSAADALPTPPGGATATANPVEAALAELEAVGLLRAYTVETASLDLDSTDSTWQVRLEGYAPTGADDCVTLPLVVELFRRLSAQPVRITATGRADDRPATWDLEITTTDPAPSHGLARVATGGQS